MWTCCRYASNNTDHLKVNVFLRPHHTPVESKMRFFDSDACWVIFILFSLQFNSTCLKSLETFRIKSCSNDDGPAESLRGQRRVGGIDWSVELSRGVRRRVASGPVRWRLQTWEVAETRTMKREAPGGERCSAPLIRLTPLVPPLWATCHVCVLTPQDKRQINYFSVGKHQDEMTRPRFDSLIPAPVLVFNHQPYLLISAHWNYFQSEQPRENWSSATGWQWHSLNIKDPCFPFVFVETANNVDVCLGFKLMINVRWFSAMHFHLDSELPFSQCVQAPWIILLEHH